MNHSHKHINLNINDMTIIAVFAAIISIISVIPTGIYILGIPLTLQTFAVAFSGYVLGARKGTIAVIIYILLGAIGLPVYNGLNGGIHVLTSAVGGFIIGFVFISLFAGIKLIHPVISGIAGILLCHIIGIAVATFFLDTNLISTALAVSLPCIPKDIICIILAYTLARTVKRRVHSAGISL